MDTNKTIKETAITGSVSIDELANLKNINEIDNNVYLVLDDLVFCTATEEHVREVAELWANLASIQQVFAPQRYDFKQEEKNWQNIVRKKLAKKNNLLLVVHKKEHNEVRGFLYLQTITLPSSNLVLKGVIEDIYTKPQYRKQNIANQLLDISLEWAFNQNIKQVDLVSISNIRDTTTFYLNYLKKTKSDVNLQLVTI